MRSMVGVVPFLFLMVGALIMALSLTIGGSAACADRPDESVWIFRPRGAGALRDLRRSHRIAGLRHRRRFGRDGIGLYGGVVFAYFYMAGYRLVFLHKCVENFIHGAPVRRGRKRIGRARRAQADGRRGHAPARAAQRQTHTAGTAARILEDARHHHPALATKSLPFAPPLGADLDRTYHMLCAHRRGVRVQSHGGSDDEIGKFY